METPQSNRARGQNAPRVWIGRPDRSPRTSCRFQQPSVAPSPVTQKARQLPHLTEIGLNSAPAMKKGLNFDPPLKGQQSCPIAEREHYRFEKKHKNVIGKRTKCGQVPAAAMAERISAGVS